MKPWLDKYESLLFVLPMEDSNDKIPKLIRQIQIRLLEKLKEKEMLIDENKNALIVETIRRNLYDRGAELQWNEASGNSIIYDLMGILSGSYRMER